MPQKRIFLIVFPKRLFGFPKKSFAKIHKAELNVYSPQSAPSPLHIPSRPDFQITLGRIKEISLKRELFDDSYVEEKKTQ